MSARTGVRCDRTAAWKQLQAHYAESGRSFDLRTAFETDGDARFAAFSEAAPHVFADLSKNLIDARTEALLLALAPRDQAWRRTATRCSPASRSTAPRTAR